MIKEWWDITPKNDIHKLLLQIALVVICWDLWKSLTTYKYGEQKKFYNSRIEFQIIWHIQAAIQDTYHSY